MVKILNRDLEVGVFELALFIHFQAKTLGGGKGYNPPLSPPPDKG